MHITLDQEQWETGRDATLGDILAEISERAHARARLVTSLTIDRRAITDRDIDPVLMAEPAARFTQITATSQSMQDIKNAAQDSIRRYAALIHTEGLPLINSFRLGRENVEALDRWLGKLADYLELIESDRSRQSPADADRGLASWIQNLLDARFVRDTVRMADLLEYEILPRLQA